MDDQMTNIDSAVAAFIKSIPFTPEPGDYLNDGKLICSKCHTPRQKELDFDGETLLVPLMCQCRSKERAEQEQRDQAAEFETRVKKARQNAIADDELRAWTFETDDKSNQKLSESMRRYAANFAKMQADNVGLLLYGPVGTGKTFFSACIVNELCKRGNTALMTSFVRIVNGIPGGFDDEKRKYFDQLQKFDLLVIDDLGAERQSEYMLENVYNVIDARYRSGRPVIITTNLDLDAIRKPSDVRYSRIYDRIQEMCHPVFVDGVSRRRATAGARYETINKLLGI